MTTLSIILPENLAKASQELAQELGLSRTEFIRQAIAHEIKWVKAKFEEKAMVNSMLAMKNDPGYIELLETIEDEFGSELPDEEDEWWNKNY